MMNKAVTVFMALALLFSGCSKPVEKPIVVSVDVWVGASPLYYAAAKGWLDEANIKMLIAPNITENIRNYTSHACDMVTGTNREYKVLQKTTPDIIPIIVYDRSYGGDVVLANRSVDELKKSSALTVYLEKDTVGEEMWNYFSRYEGIDPNRTTVLGRFQEELRCMSCDKASPASVIVTYNPHNLLLMKNGYREVASSKDDRYLIVDGIFVSKTFAALHKEQLQALHKAMQKAVEAYRSNPKEFYGVVKANLENISYEEFQQMVKNIQWVLPRPSERMQKQLEASGYPTKELL